MTTNSPFPWHAAADPALPDPTLPGTATAWPPQGAGATEQVGARGWPPDGLPPEWGPPALAGPPLAAECTASRVAGAGTASAGWPLPGAALTHHPAALPGELGRLSGGHGLIPAFGGERDSHPAGDVTSTGDDVTDPPSAPWPATRAPADSAPADSATELDGPAGVAAAPLTPRDRRGLVSSTGDGGSTDDGEDREYGVERTASPVTTAGPGSGPSPTAASSGRRREDGTGRERGEQAISKTAAVAIATRFTADVLSWDEDAPEIRTAALCAYTDDPGVGANTAAVGWDGRGRQRVDLVLPPEQVRRLATGEIVVSLTMRVVTYIRTAAIWSDPTVTGGGHASSVPRHAIAPAAAPSPDTPGWAAAPAHWVTLSTIVHRAEAGHLVVDLA